MKEENETIYAILGVQVFSKAWCHNTSVGCVLYTGIFVCMGVGK